jgi:hypothetical protein
MARTATLDPTFLEEEVSARGTTYRFRELSIGEYDDLVKKATTKVPNPLTGADEESIDNTLLLKLMVIKCSIEPKLTPEILAGLPMRVVLKLNQTVNRMHYGDEPEALDASNGTGKEPEDEEGAAPGND